MARTSIRSSSADRAALLAAAAVAVLLAPAAWRGGTPAGPRAGTGPVEPPRPRSEAGPESCKDCHGPRVKAFSESVHGQLPLRCGECHDGADAHAASLGSVRATHPRELPADRALALCASCHEPADPAFPCHERLKAADPKTCLGCHSFHGFARGPETSPAASHGIPSAASDAALGAGAVLLEGAIEVGVRGVRGRSRQYRSDVNLDPGPRLVRGSLRAADPAAAGGPDHLVLDVRGVGDPWTEARIETGRARAWSFRAAGSRSEDLFDPTTPLHDLFAERLEGSAEAEAELSEEIRVVLGYHRQDREADGRIARYRALSNERFEGADRDLDETADLGRLAIEWRRDAWALRFRQTVRSFRREDERSFRDPNLVLDDFEDFVERERALTTGTSLSGGGPVAGDRVRLEFEAFFAWSRRRFDATSAAGGLTAAAVPYLSALDADGIGFGRYLRFETAAAWMLADDLEAEVRVRYRQDDEDSRGDLEESLQVPPAAPPVLTITETSASVLDRTFDVEPMVRWRASEALAFGLGYAGRFEDVETRGPRADDVSPVDHGLLAEVDVRPSDAFRVRGRLRAFTAEDPATALTADRRARAGLDFRWRAFEPVTLTAGAEVSRTRLAAGGSDAERDGIRAGVQAGGDEDFLSGRISVSWSRFRSEVETVAQVGGFPVPYEASFGSEALVWSAEALLRPVSALRLGFGADLADVTGDNSSRFLRAFFTAGYELSASFSLQGAVIGYDFDGTESDADDFDSTVFELSLAYRF